MSEPSLRLFSNAHHEASPQRTNGPATSSDRHQRELDRLAGTAEPKRITIPLGKIVPLLMDAVANDRAWLKDFANDPIQLDSDLYDVLLAYQALRNRAAA